MAKRERIDLRPGDEHSIALEGLMTAGYVWEPEDVGDENVAEVNKAEGRGDAQGLAIGGSLDEVFEIRALRPGTTTVRFVQRRPWDPSEQANEHIVDLHVTD